MGDYPPTRMECAMIGRHHLQRTILACLLSGSTSHTLAQEEFDSAVNVALDGTIDGATVITDSDDPVRVEAQVREQLRYAIGQMNGMLGGVDSTRLAITLGTGTPRSATSWTFTYDAAMTISWPRQYQVPATYTLVLPAHGDQAGRQRFVQSYGNDEAGAKRCLADDAHGVSTGSFWYYYRPFKNTCPLARATGALIKRVPMKLALSPLNTTGKSPEYGKVWEDGKLVVTIVMSKYEEGATSVNDAGIAAYREMYASLAQTFGSPRVTSLPRGAQPSASWPEIRATYASSRGPVDVAIFLVDSPASAGEGFRLAYEARTETSDVVAYNGHAGLGANIRALTGMGRYLPGQYQIFLLNGCDTFSYVDDTLLAAHQAVNPVYGPSKYVDVITNARPSLFSEMTRATLALTKAMVGKTKTYRTLLSELDPSQRAAVTGEEDNRWPQPFE